MKIVLINPAKLEDIQQFRWGGGHLGLGYLAAVLESSGYEVSVIDAKFHKLTSEAISKEVENIQPDIVGLTAMTHEIHTAHKIAQKIKNINKDILVVVGGPHPTALPERTLLEFPDFDIAVFGEGEETLPEVVNRYQTGRKDMSGIHGCAFKINGKIEKNSPRPFMDSEKLNNLPFPAWHLFPDQRFPLYAGRGCPFRCEFCMRVLGNKLRMRSPENVIEEIEYLYKRFKKKASWFQDETFGINKRWTREFLNLLEEFRNRYQVDWKWKANSRVNLANYDIYRRMHELGCRELDFGIESGNEVILRTIQKNISLDKALRAVRLAKKAGMKTNAFFIIGHPNESIKQVVDTIRFAAKLNADGIAVGVMVPYPGTQIWAMAQKGEGGYQLLSEDWNLYDKYFGDALRLKNLSENQLKMLQSLCYLWYYARNFKFKKLFSFIKEHHREAIKMMKILLGKKKLQPV